MPSNPIPSEFHKGTLLYASGKGVERCWLSDRKVVGTWSHNFHRQDVEEVIWLSPRLLSRWTGYLAAKEKWLDSEKQRRWNSLCELLGDKSIFVVRLSAYPKVSPFGEEEQRPSFADLDQVRFQITIDGSALPRPPLKYFVGQKEYRSDPGWQVREASHRAHPIATLRGRERGSLERFEWWNATPLHWVLGSGLSPSMPKGLGYTLGWYRSDWHWVETDVQAMSAAVSNFQFRIFSPGKERVANFSLANR